MVSLTRTTQESSTLPGMSGPSRRKFLAFLASAPFNASRIEKGTKQVAELYGEPDPDSVQELKATKGALEVGRVALYTAEVTSGVDRLSLVLHFLARAGAMPLPAPAGDLRSDRGEPLPVENRS